MNRRLSLKLALIIVVCSVLAVASFTPTAPARAVGLSVSILSTSCSSASISIVDDPGFDIAFLFIGNGQLISGHRFTVPNTNPFIETFNFPAQPDGTEILIAVEGSTLFSGAFICGNNGTFLPDKRVLAAFSHETQLYSAPNDKAVIPGLTLHSGQHWFVFGISSDKRFYHVFISGGVVAWVHVDGVQLLGPAPWQPASDEDDNGATIASAQAQGPAISPSAGLRLGCFTLPGTSTKVGNC